MDSPEIQLIDSSQLDEASSYIALSHCWGKENLITTTRATESTRREAIQLKELSNTFRDAVEMTRCLGLQYIWIDSLCIIQQDQQG